MYNLVLDKKFTEPLGKFSPGKKQNFGPGTTMQFPSSNSLNVGILHEVFPIFKIEPLTTVNRGPHLLNWIRKSFSESLNRNFS
jgi:hypothetical protein